MSAASLAADDWVARLRQIPDAHRDFVVDLERAELEFGLDEVAVRELVARGLPCMQTAEGLLLAAGDLHYLGLRLGCATVYLNIMRGWERALTRAAERDETPMAVRCIAYAEEGTAVSVIVGPGERQDGHIDADQVAAGFAVRMSSAWPPVDPALGELWRDVAGLDFCWLPQALQEDVGFVRRTGLSDCASAARLLADECTRRGCEARTGFGLLLAPPIATQHNWVELREREGRWVPSDPMLLALLTRYAGLDPAAWPPTRSPGAVLLRLADRATPLVYAGDEPIEASFHTWRLDPASAR